MNTNKITGAKKPLKPVVFDLEIDSPPPSFMLSINPQECNIKLTPKIFETRTRQTSRDDVGFIVQVHHDELDAISMSGKTAMFYTNNGLEEKNIDQSEAYQNLQKMIAIYRNNGTNPNSPNKYKSTIKSVGRVLLTYDGYIYKGHFENFSVTKAAESPYNYDFSFDYKVTENLNLGSLMYNRFFGTK